MSAGGGADGGVDAMLSITTPLGPDVLHPIGLAATEGISALFAVSVTLVSTQQTIDADSLLFQPVCLTIHRPPVPDRYFHGIVRSFTASGLPVRGRWRYEAELVPKLWFLGQTADCRIFQNVSIKDILTTLFGENGLTDYQFKIYGETPTLDYVTQYNETDLAFATRLMEEAGYFYFFQHAAGGHTLVVSDRNQAFTALAQPEHYVVHAGGNAEVLVGWHKAAAPVLGKYTATDYDPENPATLPTGNTQTTLKTAGAPLRDVFRWPALTLESAQVTARTKLRIEAAEAVATLYEGAGTDHAFVPGGKFTIARDPFDGSEGTEYVVRGISHSAQDETWVGGSLTPSYANSFTAFPSKTVWRQPLTVPRPVMAGVYSAIVLGNDGEEIHSERLGRVKVRFFWDHRQDATANTVCWVRVLQPWSGNSWGWQHLPRVGTEVAIGFMDSDPDRPVMIGCFYNGALSLPFAVPGEQTKSGLRTRSTLGGGTSDFNELSFDDKMGSELVFLHAQKDMFTEIENNQTLTVDNCRFVTIKQDETIDIGNDQKLTVKNDQTVAIKNDQKLTVTNNRTTEISQGNDKLTVQLGNLTVETSTGSISETALQSITLKVGANSLKIDQEGVTITGLMVKVQAQTLLQMQGLMTQASGDAMLTLKGGIMMLN